MMTESNDADHDVDVQALLDHRKQLDDLRISQITSYDKALLWLSTGGVGLSLLVLQGIVERQQPVDLFSIVSCWLFFAAAIVLNLMSYQTSFEDVTKEIGKIDADIAAGRYISQEGNLFRSLTVWLNRLTLFCFGCGTMMLFYFTYMNLIAQLGVTINVD